MSIVSILELRVKECEEHNALLQRENDCNHKQLSEWRNRLIRADDRAEAEHEQLDKALVEVERLKGENNRLTWELAQELPKGPKKCEHNCHNWIGTGGYWKFCPLCAGELKL